MTDSLVIHNDKMRSMISADEFVDSLKAESPTAEHSLDDWTPERVVDYSRRGQMLAKGWVEATRTISKPSNQLYAARNLLGSTGLQLERLSSWARLEADLSALVHRNLIELKFWASFIANSEENATCFLTEFVVDVAELGRKWLEQPQDQQRYLAEFYKALKVVHPVKRIPVSRDSYLDDFHHKLCSKFIHPSSLIVNNTELLTNDFQRRSFQSQALSQASILFEIIKVVFVKAATCEDGDVKQQQNA